MTTNYDSVSISTNLEHAPVYCAGCGFPIMPRNWLVKVTKKEGEKSFQVCYACFQKNREPKV
jgi:hypothetical protein